MRAIREEPDMWAEYKAFLFRGNLLDLAVAFILGVAFSAVVTAFTEGLIMNPITQIFGDMSVEELAIGPFLVGGFLNAMITFVIVATVLFFLMRAASKFQRSSVDETPTPDTDEVILLREIRDALQTPRL
jgi:large conductance mechanosensitive channel